MTTQFVTSTGRIVWGNPARANKKTDQKTRQPVLRDGKQVEQWAFGLAFPKAEFQQYIMPYLNQEASTLFPQGVPPQFSWKIKDGDSVDRQGKPYSSREGYAGCYVLTISTEAFAPPIFKFENGAFRQLAQNEIKTGDYVAVNLTVKANKPADQQMTPGIYVNPNGIELIGYGHEIVSASADPDELFSGVNRALPPGASAVPVSSAPANVAPPTNYPAPGQQPPQGGPVNVPGGYIQTPPPAQLPPPAYDFVNHAGAPAGYPAPNAAPNAGYPPTMPGHQPMSTGYPAPGAYPSNGMPPLPGQR